MATVLTMGLDEATHAEVAAALGAAGVLMTTLASTEALRADEAGRVLFVQADRRRRGGVQICRQVAETHPATPVVVLAERGSLDVAAEAVRAGAYDFIVGPFERALLERAIERALEHSKLRQEVRTLRDAAAATNGNGNGTTDARSLPSMEEVERRHLLHVLEAVGGNKATAARVLGVDRTTLYRKLERYAASARNAAR